ncbi:MAG TPA: hypothetical protein VGV87_05700 [Blastocatellia bacterium]|nr:hypothetical protein [Blastocatellia bacterium]
MEAPIFRVFGQALPGETRLGHVTGGEVFGLLLGKMIKSGVIRGSFTCVSHCVQYLRKNLSFCTHYAGTGQARSIRIAYPSRECLSITRRVRAQAQAGEFCRQSPSNNAAPGASRLLLNQPFEKQFGQAEAACQAVNGIKPGIVHKLIASLQASAQGNVAVLRNFATPGLNARREAPPTYILDLPAAFKKQKRRS